MAHWIIDFHGFGGTYYTCSECGESWNDIYKDVSMEDKCPSCDCPMDEDDVEYDEYKKTNINVPIIPTLHLGKFTKITNESEIVRKFEENEHRLLQVSGYDVEKLIELFTAGYTLQPPKYEPCL